ncbi:MAG: hypothetical protein OXC07_09150 [Kistimonas sp.]|nr:hypothetical protein [Kistimonas sp.]
MKSNHINALRAKSKLLAYTHPEVVNHPEQAYTATAKGLRWLKEQGILVNKSAKPGSPPSRQENPP